MRYWSTMNEAQRITCRRLYDHNVRATWLNKTHLSSESYLTFRRRFHEHDGGAERNREGSFFGGFIPSGLFIGIETDGHAHS